MLWQASENYDRDTYKACGVGGEAIVRVVRQDCCVKRTETGARRKSAADEKGDDCRVPYSQILTPRLISS